MKNVINIGEVIKAKRRVGNITQAELASLLKVTPQTVSRWETGISYPNIAMVPAISKALHVSADELLCNAPFDSSQMSVGVDEQREPILDQSQADSIFDYVPSAITEKHRSILVVDDSDFMRMMLEDILTSHGHNVLMAENGQECLNILQKETVDLCVLDIAMPVLDGMETLKIIKKEHPGVEAVMLSAMSTESMIRMSKELGAKSFVVKPFQAQCLLERITVS